jgi:serine/threonine protein kinase
MSAVYLARQISLDRYVVLKILPREVAADPESMFRIAREKSIETEKM